MGAGAPDKPVAVSETESVREPCLRARGCNTDHAALCTSHLHFIRLYAIM